ncbi:RES domain-containing protein [Crystallibacter degradans]|uniref:RES domain-containing protein n=1 Tax=Crystallibacter degradans TaxID=2726743 RepID=UPI00147627EE|nr:RES domain-containing protein [Arthrobacter sp. SF27]
MITTPDGRQTEPLVEVLPAGTTIYRVHDTKLAATEFNPGYGRSRFAFFGDPPVPALSAAETEAAAVAETLLHDIPVSGGEIELRLVQRKVLSPLLVRRELRLAALLGDGFRRLGVERTELTVTPAARYGDTVRWAEALHAGGVDGLVWMSNRHDTSRAYILFGDRVAGSDLAPREDGKRAFAFPDQLDWLTRRFQALGVNIVGNPAP